MLFDYKKIKSLNGTETTVYHYFLDNTDEHLDDILKMSIRDVARETYTSSTTVLRFCKKMGCSGFDDFKEQLKQYVHDKYELNQMDEIQYVVKSLDFIHNPDFQEKVQKFASLAAERKQMIFIGTGNSGSLAGYGARYFSNCNCFATSIDDPFYPVPADASQILLIMISETGETQEMNQKLLDYKSVGAKTVLITNHPESRMAHNSDLVFSYSTPENYLIQTYNITTAVPVVFILEILAREVAKTANAIY